MAVQPSLDYKAAYSTGCVLLLIILITFHLAEILIIEIIEVWPSEFLDLQCFLSRFPNPTTTMFPVPDITVLGSETGYLWPIFCCMTLRWQWCSILELAQMASWLKNGINSEWINEWMRCALVCISLIAATYHFSACMNSNMAIFMCTSTPVFGGWGVTLIEPFWRNCSFRWI